MKQRTIQNQIEISGRGLHGGLDNTMVLKPSGVNSGIVFVLNGFRVPALYTNVRNTMLSTGINTNDAAINTIEHMMATLSAFGVDNVDITLENSEVPILDGSAMDLVNILTKCGIKVQSADKRCYRFDYNEFKSEHKSIVVHPSDELTIEMNIDFDGFIGKQSRTYKHTLNNFITELAPAKTFCREVDIDNMRDAGLIKGGSVDNAVIYGDNGALNDVRFVDEPVRHKILDFVGDLYTMGCMSLGHFVIHSTGHEYTNKFLRYVLDAKPFVLHPLI